MIVTATEFKSNFGKYLEMSKDKDIYITKNGKITAKISNPNISVTDQLTGLLEGKVDNDITLDDIRHKRLLKYELPDR